MKARRRPLHLIENLLTFGIGIDSVHNPEFTICEFYKRYYNLKSLIDMTQSLFRTLQAKDEERRANFPFDTEFDPLPFDFNEPFHSLDFIPTLETRLTEALGDQSPYKLPNLEDDAAEEELRALYLRLGLPLPSTPTLPRLLDHLCSTLIEKSCTTPTWIKYHPAVMSPLAKSFRTDDGQLVSARAELFINGQEYVNCYEEENSPFEQRRKFLQQKAIKDRAALEAGGEAADTMETAVGESPGFKSGIDEGYIEALEWGMPPTGGWGCGVDRIVMLFAGAKRIADVLPFGNLRNVVAMGKPWRT